MKRKFRSGFTLIELLVVIAIIGILAAVILTAVNSAKIKAKDAAVKSGVVQAGKQAEIFFDGDYTKAGIVCGPGCESLNGTNEQSNIAKIATNFSNNGSVLSISLTPNSSAPTSYLVSAPLVSNPAQVFSVNSSGSTVAGTLKISPYGTPLGNGGFETGKITGQLGGWNPDGPYGSASFAVVNNTVTPPHSGTYSIKLHSGGPSISGNHMGIISRFSTIPTKTYQVSFWAKADNVGAKVTSASEIDYCCNRPVSLGTTWQNISYSFVATSHPSPPASSANNGTIFGIYNLTTANSNIYIDDVTLEELP